MNDWAWAAGADTTAKVATAAAINFEVMSNILPEFAGKVDARTRGVNPCHRRRWSAISGWESSLGAAFAFVARCLWSHAPKVWSGNLLPCLVNPASMRRKLKVRT